MFHKLSLVLFCVSLKRVYIIKVSSISILLSTLILIALAFQLGHIAMLDATGVSLSRANLLVFLLILCFGLLLVVINPKAFIINLHALIIFLLFALLVSIVYVIKNNIDLLAFLISRHGFFTWMLIGFFVGIAVANLRLSYLMAQLKNKTPYLPVLGILAVCVLVMNFYGYSIISDMHLGIDYQSAGAAGAKLVWLTQLIFVILMGGYIKKWYIPYVVIVGACATLTISLLLSGSALIVAFLISNSMALLAVMLGKSLIRSIVKLSGLSLLSIFILLSYLDSLEFVLAGTRLEGISDGVLGITSVNSRLSGFSEFPNQFAVDPIIGNYDSHTIAQSGDGFYMHSVMLSLLSHAGLIGFSVFSAGFITILIWQWRFASQGDQVAGYNFWSLLAVFVLGSFVAFFTWTPLWFVIGMCLVSRRKPVFNVDREKALN